MNVFKRITATFSGSIESAVAQLENHEAVVQAALKDTRAMAAQARVRLMRVQKDGQCLSQKLDKLTEMEQLWSQRALEMADSDQQKALECVRRRNRSREQIAVTTTALSEHKLQEKKLIQSVELIEARSKEIENSKNLLRTRQSAAEAQKAVGKLASVTTLGLDDVLERWEMRILETEYVSPVDVSSDVFEQQFQEEEDMDELQAQLDELKRQGK